MGKKKNDFEASDNGTKKVERPHMVLLPVSVARLMHANWTPCDGWRTCTCLVAELLPGARTARSCTRAI
jgi:hypothetical protein